MIIGGHGNDTVTGGSDKDTIYGGSGNDTISTQGGNDIVFGQDGNDSITTSQMRYGSYLIDGGAGSDVYEAYLSNKIVIEDTEGEFTTINITRPDEAQTLDINQIYFGYQGNVTYSGGTVHFSDDSALYIYDAENYLKWKNNPKDTNLAGIQISKSTLVNSVGNPYNYLIITNSDSVDMLDGPEINVFSQEIASWISTNADGYSSVEAVIADHNSGKIDASTLIAKFDNFHMLNHSGMA